jgi:hypothetical protein
VRLCSSYLSQKQVGTSQAFSSCVGLSSGYDRTMWYPSCHQPSELDQIDDFRRPILWLAEANSLLPDEKWLKLQAWIWSISWGHDRTIWYPS